MARHVILGNGSLTVGLDESGLVHDFYYPYVGLDNLTTSRSTHHKIGVWIDGTFSWVDDGAWEISVDFHDDALIAHVMFTNHDLGVHIETQDFVHPQFNAFCRQMKVTSLFSEEREVCLFMHQVFEISRNGRADTAMYVPDDHYIYDYKGKECLLIAGQDSEKRGFDQYAVGNYGIEGKEGTFRDAEDGELSGSNVEHGGVDSVIRFSTSLGEGESRVFDYWITAGETQKQTEDSHKLLKADGLAEHIKKTKQYWREWFMPAERELSKLPAHQAVMARKSLMIIKSHTDNHGGVIASCDSSIYNYGRDYYSYVWPRDGAYAMWPLIRLGIYEEPKKFFSFCKNIITDNGYVMHKYQPDGAVGSTWHPLMHNHHRELAIQEDETAIVLYMLYEYFRASEDLSFIQNIFDELVIPAANFMASFIDEATGLPHASYDLWEEKFLTSTYTVATVYGGLLAAIELAKAVNHTEHMQSWQKALKSIRGGLSSLYNPNKGGYRKGLLLQTDGSLGFDDTLDISSLFGMKMFAAEKETNEYTNETLETIKSKMLNKSPSGGLPRYEHDQYFASEPPYLGNPWFVSTLWLAQVMEHHGDRRGAQKLLDWTLQKTLPSGVLSEQIDPSTSEAKSVTPLVWSHAELINTMLDLA